MIEMENQNNALQIHYVWNSGSASIEVENGGSTLTGSLPVTTSQWVHVVVKKESNIIKKIDLKSEKSP